MLPAKSAAELTITTKLFDYPDIVKVAGAAFPIVIWGREHPEVVMRTSS
jgi:hypothetical protein